MNKYRKWHNAIITRAKNRELDGYCEKHHIKPKCLGGSDKKSNIVKLTYREHFLVHWLLTKFTKGEAQRKVACALHRMCHSPTTKDIITGWQYEISRRANHNVRKGIEPWNKGKKNPALSISMMGNTRGIVNKGPTGQKIHTEEWKKQLSERMKGTSYGKGVTWSAKRKKEWSKSKKEWWKKRHAEQAKYWAEYVNSSS